MSVWYKNYFNSWEITSNHSFTFIVLINKRRLIAAYKIVRDASIKISSKKTCGAWECKPKLIIIVAVVRHTKRLNIKNSAKFIRTWTHAAFFLYTHILRSSFFLFSFWIRIHYTYTPYTQYYNSFSLFFCPFDENGLLIKRTT